MPASRQLIAVLLAFVLGCAFLGRSLLPGYTLLPQDPRSFAPLDADIDAATLDAAEHEVVPSRRDKLLQFLPYDTAVAESWRRGQVPLWESRILCGMPLLAQTTSRSFYPTAAAFALFAPASVYAWTYLLHLVLAGLFAYRLVVKFGGCHAGGLLATASIVLSGYAVGHVHHPMIFMAAVWILPALELTQTLLADAAARGKHAALLAFCVALSWLAGFSQASVVLCYLVAGLVLFDAVGRRVRAKRAVLVGLGLTIGTGIALVQLMPAVELAGQSARTPGSLDTIRALALAPVHLLELIVPGQLAAPGDIAAAGPFAPRPTFLSLFMLPDAKRFALNAGIFNHTETALGFGIWPLAFALRALFSHRTTRRAVAFLWAASLTGLLAALGTPGLIHVLALLPGIAVGDFRRMLVLPAMCLPILAGLGFGLPRRSTLRGAAAAGFLLIGAGIALVLVDTETFSSTAARLLGWRWGIGEGTVLANFADGEAAANQRLLAAGMTGLGVALASAPCLVGLVPGRALPFVAATACQLLLVARDVSPTVARSVLDAPDVLTALHTEQPFPSRLIRVEHRDHASKSDVRLLPPNLPLVYGLGDACGYGPLPPKRTEEFFEALEPGSSSGGAGVGTLRRASSLESGLIDLLGVDHVLANVAPPPGYEQVWMHGECRVLRRTKPGPRARLFYAHRVVPRAKLRTELAKPTFDPALEVLLEAAPAQLPGPADPEARVEVVHFEPGHIKLRTESKTAALLFVSEGWAPGWRVSIDRGDATRSVPADLMFQAIPLPEGKHDVEMSYSPASFRFGAWFSCLALVASLVTIVAFRTRETKDRGDE